VVPQRKRWIASGAAVISGGIAFLVFFSAYLLSPLSIPLRTDQRSLSRGFYSVETNKEHIFAWTGPHAEFTLPALDRDTDWRVTLEIKVWRPAGVPLPRVRVGVDGIVVTEQVIAGDMALAATAPRRAGARGITVSIDTTPAFAPGPRDTRRLGVAVASMTLEPIGGVPRAPRRAAASGLAAIAILATAVAALGVPSLLVAAFAILVAWGEAALMARGIGPYVQYPLQVLALAAGLGAGVLAAVWSVERLRRERLSSVATCVVALCLAAGYLKLLMLLHPNMPIGDGVFHAHRFEYVLAGRFYFTSLTPDNYAFPYPIFLYLVAAPFAWLTSDTLDRLALLRIILTVADAGAATLVYWMIVRATSDRVAGIAGAVWYHVMPMTAWIMTWGALTNGFAQTLFVASLALVVALPVERTRRRSVVLLTIVVAAALLTHPSTCAILVGVLAATSALYAWRDGTLRSAAAGIALATASATVIAVVLYYAWFPSVYVSELARVASASVAPVAAPAGATRGGLTRAIGFLDIYFGWPAIAVAAIGGWRLSRDRPSPRLGLLLLGWAGICLVFLVVGILTPIEMRYHFAAFPALAIAAGFACSWAWRSGVAVRLTSAALVFAGVWDGVAQWLWAMTDYARMVR
jgi:hypothetical protein